MTTEEKKTPPNIDKAIEVYRDSLSTSAAPDFMYVARRFGAFMLQKGGREWDKATVNAYIDARRRKNLKESTLAKEFNTIRRIFVVNGIPWPFRRNEGPRPSERQEDRTFLYPEVIDQLIMHSPRTSPEHMAILGVSTTYGCRREEMTYHWDPYDEQMVGIGPDSFNWRSRLLYIETAKHGRARYHLIPEPLIPVFRAYDWRPRTKHRVSELFKDLVAAAELDVDAFANIGWHSIRRSVDRALEQADVPPTERTVYMRWSRSRSDQSVAYATGGIGVGIEGRGDTSLAAHDSSLDEKAFKSLPWLGLWAEIQRLPLDDAG